MRKEREMKKEQIRPDWKREVFEIPNYADIPKEDIEEVRQLMFQMDMEYLAKTMPEIFDK